MRNTAYTIEYSSMVNAITTPCGISKAFDQQFYDKINQHPPFMSCTAIWDTGANGSVISSQIVRALGIKPFRKARVIHAGGESVVNTYLVNILLPNQVEIKTLQVTEGAFTDTDILIGMDIIAMCDFAISLPNGKNKFTFQIPSEREIDFIKH